MKITKSQLKRIIKEELENVLNEDLGNLAGMIILKNKKANPPWLRRGEWPPPRRGEKHPVYEDTPAAFGAMMSAAYSFWNSGDLLNNLNYENQQRIKDAATKIAALKSAGESGAVPSDAGAMIFNMPDGRSVSQAIVSGFGKEIGLQPQKVTYAPPAVDPDDL